MLLDVKIRDYGTRNQYKITNTYNKMKKIITILLVLTSILSYSQDVPIYDAPPKINPTLQEGMDLMARGAELNETGMWVGVIGAVIGGVLLSIENGPEEAPIIIIGGISLASLSIRLVGANKTTRGTRKMAGVKKVVTTGRPTW